MISQLLSGQLINQLIQDLDYSIALNKGFVLALNYEIWLLKLNGLEHINPIHTGGGGAGVFHLQTSKLPRTPKRNKL